MTIYKQNKVSKAVWAWTVFNRENVSVTFSLKSAVFGMLIGTSVAGLLLYFNHMIMGGILLFISWGIFFSALFLPLLYGKICFFLSKFSFFVGQVLTWGLFVPFFYLFFPLGRLSQKIRGKDPMCRELSSTLSSYWIKRKSEEKLEQYKRQF